LVHWGENMVRRSHSPSPQNRARSPPPPPRNRASASIFPGGASLAFTISPPFQKNISLPRAGKRRFFVSSGGMCPPDGQKHRRKSPRTPPFYRWKKGWTPPPIVQRFKIPDAEQSTLLCPSPTVQSAPPSYTPTEQSALPSLSPMEQCALPSTSPTVGVPNNQWTEPLLYDTVCRLTLGF
jgi:hypothetical protein